MPRETMIVVVALTAAFAVFAIALFWAEVRTRNVHRDEHAER